MAQGFIYLLAAYAGAGLVFALAFTIAAVARIDSQAKGSGLPFRLLIFPGAAALWPLLLRRWYRGTPDPAVERNPHRRAGLL